MATNHDITTLLARGRDGDDLAQSQVAELIYPQLKKVAGRRLARQRVGSSRPALALQTTELVHETFIQLLGQRRVDWQSRAHFFAIAARLMRRVLLESARFNGRAKRGSGRRPVSLESVTLAVDGVDLDAVALDQTMRRLRKIDPRAARVVELRYFSGMSLEEVAAALGVGTATITRSWRFARSWLQIQLKPDQGISSA